MNAEERNKPHKTFGALSGTRISTGIDGVDRVLGRDFRTRKSGLHVPSVVLLVGASGCGKSTLALRIAASMRPRSFLFITSEQTSPEIRENTKRLGLDKSLASIPLFYTRKTDEVFRKIRELNSQVVVVDSINELSGSIKNSQTPNSIIKLVKRFKDEAELEGRAFILVSQLSKKAERVDVQRVQHIVSAVMLLEKRGPMTRLLLCSKNRFGSLDERAVFDAADNWRELR